MDSLHLLIKNLYEAQRKYTKLILIKLQIFRTLKIFTDDELINANREKK